MAQIRSRSTDFPPHSKSATSSTRQLQEALYTHLDDLEKSAFIDALSSYREHRDIFELVNALRKILNTPVKRKLFPLVRKIIRQGDVKAFDLLTKADKQSGTLPRPYLYRPHIADINVLNKHRASSLPDITRGGGGQGGLGGANNRTAQHSRRRGGRSRYKGAWSGGEEDEEEEEPNADRQQRGLTGGKHKTHSTHSGNSGDEISGEVFEIDIGEPRSAGEGFGFTIRGGVEHEMGVYVSSVDHGSTAHINGLEVGDLLLEVNNISFRGIPHQEAVRIIKAATRLQLMVSRVGRIPGSHTVLESFRWTDPKGRPVSPPPEGSGGVAGEDDGRGRSGTRMLQGSDERKINILVQKGHGLGLMIRGGNEYGLGIFVSGIDPYSVAENAGIKLGDQILDVNGRSFLDISHSQAVNHLKKGRHLMFTVRDIGKIPFAKTVIDEKGWIESTRVNSYSKSGSTRSLTGSITDQEIEWKAFLRKKKNTRPPNQDDLDLEEIGSDPELLPAKMTPRSDDHGGAGPGAGEGRELIHEQANLLLNATEHATLNYYLGEYAKQTTGVQGLVQAMLELLNTQAKLTLLSEIRTAIRARDLDTFDKLVVNREQEISLTSARKQLAPDSLSLASYDSGDIPTRDKHKRTMFSKPLTVVKPPTSMKPLDFQYSKRGSGGEQALRFDLSSVSARRLSQSTPDLSQLDSKRFRQQGFLQQDTRRDVRAMPRSKSPRAAFRKVSVGSLTRGKSEEPSDDSGVEISGHVMNAGAIEVRNQRRPPRQSPSSNQEFAHHRQSQNRQSEEHSRRAGISATGNRHQQIITHVAEVHQRGDVEQQSQRSRHSNIGISNRGNNNNNNNNHRRERQRYSKRQDDSTTTDEDVAGYSVERAPVQASYNLHDRHRSLSRDRSSKVKPRSRSTSSSRQPVSSGRSQAQRQDSSFLTVPGESAAGVQDYLKQKEHRNTLSERGRSNKRYGTTRDGASSSNDVLNSSQRSSSSSASPQNHKYHPNMKQQQQQPRARRDAKNIWRPTQRNDSYTDTSTTESLTPYPSRYGHTESSARTESTLTINGKLMPSMLPPQLINSMVIEDSLVSSPSQRYDNNAPSSSHNHYPQQQHRHQQQQNVHFEERPSRSRSKSPRDPRSQRISRSRSPQMHRKLRPTAESVFITNISTDAGNLKSSSTRYQNSGKQDQKNFRSNPKHPGPLLTQPKRTPLYNSPKRAAPSSDTGRGAKHGTSEEDLKTLFHTRDGESTVARPLVNADQGSRAAGNIPLIKINSHALPKAGVVTQANNPVTVTSKALARSPAHSQSEDSETPVYAEPIKQRDRANQKRVTISDTPTHMDNYGGDNSYSAGDTDTGSLASTITSHKNVTSINVSAPPRAGNRQPSAMETTKARAREKYGEIFLDLVYIYRSQPTLGVAIEGGANTRQPLPKVINVQPGGSAFESGGLKVGHVILEVNGQPIVGLSHNAAARVIAEAFKSRSSDRMELLITEWSDSLLDTIQVDVGLLKVS